VKTANEMRKQLVEKAGGDEAFRVKLLADPKQAIKDEFDIDIGDSFELHVHEESPSVGHLLLPPRDMLDEAQLEAVAGGHWTCNPAPHTHQRSG